MIKTVPQYWTFSTKQDYYLKWADLDADWEAIAAAITNDRPLFSLENAEFFRAFDEFDGWSCAKNTKEGDYIALYFTKARVEKDSPVHKNLREICDSCNQSDTFSKYLKQLNWLIAERLHGIWAIAQAKSDAVEGWDWPYECNLRIVNPKFTAYAKRLDLQTLKNDSVLRKSNAVRGNFQGNKSINKEEFGRIIELLSRDNRDVDLTKLQKKLQLGGTIANNRQPAKPPDTGSVPGQGKHAKYHELAKKGLVMLIESVLRSQSANAKIVPITYKTFAEQIDFPGPNSGLNFARIIGECLYELVRILEQVAANKKEPVPKLQAMVVGTNSKLPGDGFENFSPEYKNLSNDEKRELVAKEYKKIKNYSEAYWQSILAKLSAIDVGNNDVSNPEDEQPPMSAGGAGFQQDPEVRARIEKNAIDFVQGSYRKQGWEITASQLEKNFMRQAISYQFTARRS